MYVTQFWKITHMGAREIIKFPSLLGFYLKQKIIFEIFFQEFSGIEDGLKPSTWFVI